MYCIFLEIQGVKIKFRYVVENTLGYLPSHFLLIGN